jgi:hypothetical protein
MPPPRQVPFRVIAVLVHGRRWVAWQVSGKTLPEDDPKPPDPTADSRRRRR